METYRVTYELVKRSVTKRFTCRVCGRRGSRSRTFRQTLNPFNRNADGLPKSAIEIRQELQEQCEQWAPDVHERCES